MLFRSDLDWSREIVVEGKTGYSCKAYDSESLAKAMKKLKKNGGRMRKACRKKALEYSLNAFKKRELKAYKELVNKQ
mgnify:CR=1 FL=1